MSTFKRATLVLMNKCGNAYEKNYSLAINVNPRWNNNNGISLMTKRNNTTDKAASSKKPKAPEPKGVSYKNLTIGVPKEVYQNERRVAITPAVTQNFVKKGFKVVVEENAGLLAKFPNDQYEKAGAKVASSKEVFSSSDFILKVRAPTISVSEH
jgi:hypothetical protein